MVASVELILATLAFAGMATGTHRQFDKGTTSLTAVILVEGVGAISLLLSGLALRSCAVARRAQPAPVVRWLFAAGFVWVFWAFLRIGEYAS